MSSSPDPTAEGSAEFVPDVTSTMVFPAPRPGGVPESVWEIHVEVLGGPMDGSRSRTSRTRLEIGRAPGNDLQLSLDPMVSGRHAVILREGQHYWLEDRGSRNGTLIGDKRLEERTLIGPGTTFTVGQTLIAFMPR